MAGEKNIRATLQEEDGKWIVRARVYDPKKGKTVQKSKTTGLRVKDNTKRKAEAMMRDIVAEWERDLASLSAAASPLFAVYVHKFIEHKKQSGIKITTVHFYKSYAETHVIPALGKRPILELTLSDLEGFYSEYLRDHTANSAHKVHVVVSGAFQEAVRDGILQRNIAKDVEFPKQEKFHGASYQYEEAKLLISKAEEAGEPINAAIKLTVYYGLRRSEVLGLRWKDIDFEPHSKKCADITVNSRLHI